MSAIPRILSEGEETFALHCQAYLHPVDQPVREHQFCNRKWRFDFAWPSKKVAVEVEGGTSFGKSRHSKGAGFERDAEKYNRAAREGWIVLRYSTRMVIAGDAINEVVEVLGEQKANPYAG
jgi:very-short-patch-repair endonuclease